MKNKKREMDVCPEIQLDNEHGAYLYQPHTYPDDRNERGIAVPSDRAIEAEHNRQIENKL